VHMIGKSLQLLSMDTIHREIRQVMDTNQRLIQKRDSKAKPHLEQYAPVWCVDEKMVPDDEAVLFNVIFQHNQYGWVNRRYRYDGFNDVLYYRGQVSIPEDQVLVVQEQQPYIETTVMDITESYGG
jgi:hypothetical protein